MCTEAPLKSILKMANKMANRHVIRASAVGVVATPTYRRSESRLPVAKSNTSNRSAESHAINAGGSPDLPLVANTPWRQPGVYRLDGTTGDGKSISNTPNVPQFLADSEAKGQEKVRQKAFTEVKSTVGTQKRN
jgi:hypothetical protein